VHHFCSHYRSNVTGEIHAAFAFAADEGDHVVVELNALKAARTRLGPRCKAALFVFLNACESSAFNPLGARSLIEMLRDDGNVAVLGAETRVPDRAASFFARRVFARLAAYQPLGRAVLRARWDLLEEWHSPAGAFFSLHGWPGLRVAPRIGTGH
jgi:hypothetical protein